MHGISCREHTAKYIDLARNLGRRVVRFMGSTTGELKRAASRHGDSQNTIFGTVSNNLSNGMPFLALGLINTLHLVGTGAVKDEAFLNFNLQY